MFEDILVCLKRLAWLAKVSTKVYVLAGSINCFYIWLEIVPLKVKGNAVVFQK